MGKDKKKNSDKSKKEKKSKEHKRRRDVTSSSESSSSEDERKRHKSEKLAQKVVQHLQKVGAATGAEPFVWTKKVEKELSEGKKVKDISIFTDQQRQTERMEEIEKVRKRQAEREAEKARREEELVSVT
ncbi:hypothetical protein CEUSTIGMA_g10644.t1 [Chlamydomonas eustigma]|uniref:Uncharacterized protein n=1 Tax=Chlamydomonas eustigma TaxID=1157962 RepID=A0A250XJG9_9CHLO|nr:hypothetical protein CEUSTIGMA_g10644.t1 [Chlamydomonas eustigma]|eukprot:GAX83218.1 hypothetical protein CEUSTIGMA_g10644.t1 [Chlamydomonas eustigma]